MPKPAKLEGQSVVVTRPREQAASLVRLLIERGARVIERPTIAINPRRDAETTQRLAAVGSDDTDALLITSANAAHALVEYASDAARKLPVYAVGPATAEIMKRHGFDDVRVSEVASSEGLLAYLKRTLGEQLRGMHFVAPQSSRARDVLITGITNSKAHVDVVVAYDTVPVLDGPRLPSGRIDWLTFTSPSAVDGFVRALTVPPGARVACLGTTTRAAAIDAGMTVQVTPREHSLVALVDAMVAAS